MENKDYSASGFERLLSVISPDLALRRMSGRMTFQAAASGGMFAGAGTSRYRNHNAWNRAMPGSEEKAMRNRDRLTLILEGQDLYRNNPIVAGPINRFADYAVCHGIPPVALSSSPEWNNTAEAWWNDVFAQTCDYRQQSDLWEFQKMALTSRLWAGGCGFVFLNNGQLDPIEYERIQTPADFRTDKNVVNGVRKTGRGLVVGYYICDRRDGGPVDLTRFRYVPAERFIHCWKPWRFDQSLGIPDLTPLIEKILDYSETDNYILNKIKNEAMRLLKYTRKGGTGAANAGFRGAVLTDDAGNKRAVKKEEWGMQFELPSGDDMEILEGKAPNAQSIEYLEMTLRVISSCFGVPYEFLLLMFKAGSYSSHRAAGLHANHTFDVSKDWLSKRMMNPLWRWRIAKAIKEGDLPPAPVDDNGVSEWWKVEWTTPFFEALDGDKQARGDKLNVELGVETVPNLIKRRGRKPDVVLNEQSEWLDKCAKRVEKHNRDHPTALITIDHLTNAATPGASGAVPASEPDNEKEPETEETE